MEALTIPVTIYVLATTNPFLPTSYHASTCDMSQKFPGVYVLVSTKTLELPIPPLEPIDIIGMQVNALRARKEQISVEADIQLNVIRSDPATAVHRPLSNRRKRHTFLRFL